MDVLGLMENEFCLEITLDIWSSKVVVVPWGFQFAKHLKIVTIELLTVTVL